MVGSLCRACEFQNRGFQGSLVFIAFVQQGRGKSEYGIEVPPRKGKLSNLKISWIGLIRGR